jgi:hypothetical protein
MQILISNFEIRDKNEIQIMKFKTRIDGKQGTQKLKREMQNHKAKFKKQK